MLVDYDSGEFTNQYNEKAIQEIFREETNISNLSLTDVIDGGFGMGQDLLFIDNLYSDDTADKPFLKKSFGAIYTGDQY